MFTSHENAPNSPPGVDSHHTEMTQRIRHTFIADFVAVRSVLKTCACELQALGLGVEEIGSIEIVLAEMLNNIVEHAYAGVTDGKVVLSMHLDNRGLHCAIKDQGVPMPDTKKEPAKLPDLDVLFDDLPEGGFGWFLIEEITKDLVYARTGNTNSVTFRIAVSPS